MRIAIFTDTFVPEINGVATSTHNLATTMKAHGHEVIVVTTNPYNDQVTFEDGVLRIPGIEVKQLYGYRASGVYNAKAFKIVASFRPDIIHVHTDFGISFFGSLCARKLGVGVVYTYHTQYEDYAYYVTKGHFDRFARHAVRWYVKNNGNRFSEFIAPSDKSKDYLRSIGVDKNITVIPTGIELTRFFPSPEDKTQTKELKKKYGIADDEYVILSLGRIAKEKSIDILISSYAKFLAGKPKKKTKFVITGLGPALDELKAQVETLGIGDHVVFTGPCLPSETQFYYHLGDCFASASITETQGLTFMEAMAAHLIVMARYDDNLLGTIVDGVTGYFFRDEEGFAKTLQSIIDMPETSRKRIVSAALKAIDVYSMERFYENVYEVYQRVWKENW